MSNSGPNGTWRATTPEWWAQITRPILAVDVWYSCAGESVRYTIHTAFEWDNLPRDGVQVVMLHHANGERHVIDGFDEYTLPSATTSKFGLEIDSSEFYRIQDAAMSDEWRGG